MLAVDRDAQIVSPPQSVRSVQLDNTWISPPLIAIHVQLVAPHATFHQLTANRAHLVIIFEMIHQLMINPLYYSNHA
jgi:hypothetical protein